VSVTFVEKHITYVSVCLYY